MPVHIHGLDSIKGALEQLPYEMQRHVLKAGNRAVANEMRKHIRSHAPNSIIARAVTVQPAPGTRKYVRGFVVGLRRPFSRMSHWFEYGTARRVQSTTGRETGAMPATPWLRPALEAIGARVEDIWTYAASRNLARQIKKLGLKND